MCSVSNIKTTRPPPTIRPRAVSRTYKSASISTCSVFSLPLLAIFELRYQVWKLSPLVLVVASCLDESHFGEFDQAEVLGFSVDGEIAPAQILADEGVVQVSLPDTEDAAKATITSLTVSSLASASQQVGDVIDLSDTFELIVTAEDGKSRTWSIERADSGGGIGGDTSM